MDFDPLSDAAPSRYAVESDEEDEYNPLQSSTSNGKEHEEFKIKIVGQTQNGRPLIATFGDAGKYWAKGADLGEQTGAVMVNNIQVGLIFSPSWVDATIVVSETFTRLPIAAMAGYASALVDELALPIFPIAILDVYAAPTYISSLPISMHDAPIRYLTKSKQANPGLQKNTELFEPPNLIHSTTSAALLSHIVTQDPRSLASLILLPFPRVPAPPPKTLQPSDFSHLTEDEYQWSFEMMNHTHNLLASLTGKFKNPSPVWQKPKHSKPTIGHQSSARSTVGEGGMYI
ncbi:hypothetical protein Moror_3032 [Moniliophthora roreri MCA 2997]|uniref:Uncharacterized protein n=1 Tax=Moniliophthora roreri (strain MCA 2997) TaxID=1381753 RepID=V2WPE8_MONRO|nr:hypothetical protein Moror_3032 [Moniliophthora roreri MCA 2997]KAI3616369.1 hypothetical protein WG66_012586 [Moniliophthora roreri]